MMGWFQHAGRTQIIGFCAMQRIACPTKAQQTMLTIKAKQQKKLVASFLIPLSLFVSS